MDVFFVYFERGYIFFKVGLAPTKRKNVVQLWNRVPWAIAALNTTFFHTLNSFNIVFTQIYNKKSKYFSWLREKNSNLFLMVLDDISRYNFKSKNYPFNVCKLGYPHNETNVKVFWVKWHLSQAPSKIGLLESQLYAKI